MLNLQKVNQIDYYLHVFFEDDSVRAIDLAPHLKIDLNPILDSEMRKAKVSTHPGAHSIIWQAGTEISSDFLYENSQLIGWIDRK